MDNNMNHKKKRLFRRKADKDNLDYDITSTDILAMIIAAFEVFIPIFLCVIVILVVMVLFVTKVWLR